MRFGGVPRMVRLVPWWLWVLLAWGVVATVAALWLAAAAGIARRRERAARAHQYGGRVEQEWREAG